MTMFKWITACHLVLKNSRTVLVKHPYQSLFQNICSFSAVSNLAPYQAQRLTSRLKCTKPSNNQPDTITDYPDIPVDPGNDSHNTAEGFVTDLPSSATPVIDARPSTDTLVNCTNQARQSPDVRPTPVTDITDGRSPSDSDNISSASNWTIAKSSQVHSLVDDIDLNDKAYATLSATERQRLRMVHVEYDVWSAEGRQLPRHMTAAMWAELSRQGLSVNARERLYHYYRSRELAKLHQQAKRNERRAARENAAAERQDRDDGRLMNTIMLFTQNQTMNQHYYWNLAHAMQHGAPLVFDCSYAAEQTPREQREAAKQLTLAHSANKVAANPFHMHLCGVARDTPLDKTLRAHAADGFAQVPCTCTEQHYLELFPRDRIVILSPDARRDLLAWDPDDVYVVGAIADVHQSLPLTLKRAKREGVRHVRLPIDRFLQWQTGSKALTIYHIMQIMLDLKDTGNWDKAFRHIPQRHLRKKE